MLINIYKKGDLIIWSHFIHSADVRVYGVDADAVGRTEDTVYEAGAGWVGVSTYVDMHGTLRVKKETLVAMSGISTGNAPLYNNPPA